MRGLFAFLGGLDGAQQACGQEDERGYQLQRAVHGDSNKPEGQ